MVAPPVPHDWTFEEIATSPNLQSLTDAIDFLLKVPRCRVSKTANQSITSNTITAVTFDTEDFDPNGFHSNVTNPSRITPTISGLYLVRASIEWDANSTGQRLVQLLVNGATIPATDSRAPSPSLNTDQQVAKLLLFNGSSDYVECRVRQISGAALNVLAAPPTFFEAAWVALDETTAY